MPSPPYFIAYTIKSHGYSDLTDTYWVLQQFIFPQTSVVLGSTKIPNQKRFMIGTGVH